MEILQREYIYPTGMKTHPNEEVYYDHTSGKPFKELYPSMYKEGWAFIGIYVEDEGAGRGAPGRVGRGRPRSLARRRRGARVRARHRLRAHRAPPRREKPPPTPPPHPPPPDT